MFWPHRNPERQASAHVLELALEYDHEAFEVHCSLCVDRVLGLEQSVLIVTVRLHNCYTCRRGSNCECVRAVLCFRSCSCVCIYIYRCVSVCACMDVSLCVCTQVCVYCVHLCMYVHCIIFTVRVFARVCRRLSLRACFDASDCVCVCTCAHV